MKTVRKTQDDRVLRGVAMFRDHKGNGGRVLIGDGRAGQDCGDSRFSVPVAAPDDGECKGFEMDVFELGRRLVSDYRDCTRSFLRSGGHSRRCCFGRRAAPRLRGVSQSSPRILDRVDLRDSGRSRHRQAPQADAPEAGRRANRGSTERRSRAFSARGQSSERCAKVLREWLLKDSELRRNESSRFPIFAFRLHQFPTRGDTVWASLEPEATRHLEIAKQAAKPGEPDKLLYPLVFCRRCGTEHYRVRVIEDERDGGGTASHAKTVAPTRTTAARMHTSICPRQRPGLGAVAPHCLSACRIP